MVYRLAAESDYPAITEFIHGKDYFMALDPATLGGYWIVAVADSGAVHGTLWFFQGGRNAYVDYWAATNGLVAGKLGSVFRSICAALGVRYVRGVVATRNQNALHFARELFDMNEGGDDYRLLFKILE